MGELIEVAGLNGGGRFPAYRAAPAGPPTAAIVVVPEIFGINPGIRSRCDRWAQAGYLALAPDLFWRIERGVQLDPDIPEQLQHGFSLMHEYKLDDGVRDIEALIRFARTEGCAMVGIVGYCMGGGLAYLAATRTDADASVGYYGGPIASHLGEAHAIARPLLLHFAGDDQHIDADKLAAIHAALDANRHVEIHEYPGVDHGFATEAGQRRDDDAAALADRRTADFFARTLA